MVLARGSHLKTYPTNERVSKKGHLTQIEIEESYITDEERVYCNLELGDAVLFSAKCAHKTGTNNSSKARVAMIVRYGEIDAKLGNGWVAN